MAFTVRCFGYRGNLQMKDEMPKQFSADSIRMLVEPYEWAQALVSNDAVPVPTVSDTAHDRVTVLKVEVPDGQSIRYEIIPPGRNVVAGPNSPRLSGIDYFAFYPGWVFSFIDQATAP